MNFPALTAKQKNRDAYGAIQGYLYQFEMTALEIFNCGETAVARIEGLEDLDKLENGDLTAIQIKYWESKKTFTNKAIAEPLYEMFQSFVDDRSLKFQLYVYFSNSGSIKKRLTQSDVADSFTSQLVAEKVDPRFVFLYDEFSKAVTIIPGPSLQEQRKELARAISSEIKCDEDEAQVLHLPRIVHYINGIACRSNDKERLINRQDLVELLGIREFYYFKWHAEYVDHEKLLIQATRLLRNANFKRPDRRKTIGIRIGEGELLQAVELIKTLTDKHRDQSSLITKLPWTVVVDDGDSDACFRLKQRLLEKTNVRFNDGFESILFSADRFIDSPVISTQRGGSLIRTMSFEVRLVSLKNYLSLDESQRELIASSSCWFGEYPTQLRNDGAEHLVLGGLRLCDVNNIIRKVL